MLQIYSTQISRAARSSWMLEETGQPYELVEMSAHPDDTQTAQYLRLTLNARFQISTTIRGKK